MSGSVKFSRPACNFIICEACGLSNLLDCVINNRGIPNLPICSECYWLKSITKKLKICANISCNTFIPNDWTYCTKCGGIYPNTL
jgi:hypothetical protein